MACEFEESAADQLWPAILQCRRFLTPPLESLPDVVAIYRHGESWLFASDVSQVEKDVAHRVDILLNEAGEARSQTSDAAKAGSISTFSYDRFVAGEESLVTEHGQLDPAARQVLRLYLPLVVGGYRARQAGRLFITAHLAQTLDGHIACRNGHSHWISNEANLHHAHRLRALHDAVVVGGRTVERDDPQLTVRHVEGEDPTRVVLNGSASVLRAGNGFQILEGAGCTLLCHAEATEKLDVAPERPQVTILPIDCPTKPLIAPDTIRNALIERGIHTAFIEGGGLTLSNYVRHRALDVLHIHFAPLILGSGIDGLSLPEVSTVQAGHHLTMEHFGMDGELLLELRDTGR